MQTHYCACLPLKETDRTFRESVDLFCLIFLGFSSLQPNSNFLLATYRCQANTTRLELKVKCSNIFSPVKLRLWRYLLRRGAISARTDCLTWAKDQSHFYCWLFPENLLVWGLSSFVFVSWVFKSPRNVLLQRRARGPSHVSLRWKQWGHHRLWEYLVLERVCGSWSRERRGQESPGTVCPQECWKEVTLGSNQWIQTGFVLWRGSKSGHSVLIVLKAYGCSGVYFYQSTKFTSTSRNYKESND